MNGAASMNRVDPHRLKTILIAGGTALAVILAIWGWFTNYHLVEKKVRVNISEEVSRNSYLVATRFLESFDKNITSYNSVMHLNDLDVQVDTLILLDLDSDLNEIQHEKVLDWVSRGGHLVLEANFVWNWDEWGGGESDEASNESSEDEESELDAEEPAMRLLDHLDLKLVDLSELMYDYEDDEEFDDESDESEDVNGEQDNAHKESMAECIKRNLDEDGDASPLDCMEDDYYWNAVSIEFAGFKAAEVAFTESYVLLPKYEQPVEDYTHYKNDARYYYVEKQYGAGRISVLSDADLWTNPSIRFIVNDEEEPQSELDRYEGLGDISIDDLDHAYFLWLLVRDGSNVWLLNDMDYPSLLKILWKYFPQAVVSASILVLLWMWWMNNAFGPRVREPDSARRSLLEHLQMTGRFEWNADKAFYRVITTRDQLLKDIKQKHPGVSRMDMPQMTDFLVELTGMKADEIHRALYQKTDNESRFIETTILLQQIRRKL